MSPIDAIKFDVPNVPAGAVSSTAPVFLPQPGGQDFSTRLTNSLQASPRLPPPRSITTSRMHEHAGKPAAKSSQPETAPHRNRDEDRHRDAAAASSTTTAQTPSSRNNPTTSDARQADGNSTTTADSTEPVPGTPPAELIAALMLADATSVSQTPVSDTPSDKSASASPPASLIDTLVAQAQSVSTTSGGSDVSQLNKSNADDANQSALNAIQFQTTSTDEIVAEKTIDPTAIAAANDVATSTAELPAQPLLGQKSTPPDGLAALLDMKPSATTRGDHTATDPSDVVLFPEQTTASLGLQSTATDLGSLIKPAVAVTETKSENDQPTSIDAGPQYAAVPAPGDFSANKPVTAAHQSRNGVDINPANIVRDVSAAISSAHESGGRIQIKLNPPELGALQIDVSVNNGTVSARLEAQTPAAQRVLSDNLSQLQQALSQQGMQVDRLEVSLADQRTGDNRPDFGERSFQQDRQPGSDAPRDQGQGYTPQERAPEERQLPPPHLGRSRQPVKQLDIKV